MLGDHRHARGHLEHLDHPGHRQRRLGIERLERAAEHRRTQDHSGQQAVEIHVHAKLRAAGDFLRGVQARGRLADQPPVLGLLQAQRGRIRHRQLPGVVGQVAVAQALVAGHHPALLGVQGRGRHLQALGRRLDQHLPGRGAGLAIAVELHPGRGRATGDLHPAERRQAIHRGGRRVLDANLRPVGIQLLGDQHRQPGPDALAHFRMAEHHGDHAVRSDAQERIGYEFFARRPGKTIGSRDDERHHQPAAEQRATFEKSTTRCSDHALPLLMPTQPISAARLTAARILG